MLKMDAEEQSSSQKILFSILVLCCGNTHLFLSVNNEEKNREDGRNIN